MQSLIKTPKLLFSASLRYESFIAQPQLEIIDLRYNEIKSIEGLTFKGLRKIREIKLSGNRITNLNSDVFENLPTLQKLDLSENFVQKFPTVSLRPILNLKFLNLSSNMLQVGKIVYDFDRMCHFLWINFY